jgi:hypothetical protein
VADLAVLVAIDLAGYEDQALHAADREGLAEGLALEELIGLMACISMPSSCD